jgi:transcriptional regulator with XRE-family HTH domain
MGTTVSAKPTPGTVLRSVRVAGGKTLTGTAQEAHLDKAQLSRIEHDAAGLTVERLAKLADVLGLVEVSRSLAPFVPKERR